MHAVCYKGPFLIVLLLYRTVLKLSAIFKLSNIITFFTGDQILK